MCRYCQMALSVCDGDISVSIALDEQRRPTLSYSRPISEQELQDLSVKTRMQKPYAFTINVSDLMTENALIKLYLVVGVTYAFDDAIAFDVDPPCRTFTCQHASRGTYCVNDFMGEYESVTGHMVAPSAAAPETYSVDVVDNETTLSIHILPFASNTASCAPVCLNGMPLKLLRADNTSYEYDASCVDEGISMLSLGGVGIGLLCRPRAAIVDAPNYTLRHGSAHWCHATLSILSYDERLPSEVPMILVSTAVKGSVIFNPHDGNLKQLRFHKNTGASCSHCPCLKSTTVCDPVAVDACIVCDTISLWARLDKTFRVACACASIEYHDGMLHVSDSNTYIQLEGLTWVHLYISNGTLVVNGRPRFDIASAKRCSESHVIGTVRALCVYKWPLEERFVAMLSEYPDMILQQVSIKYRVSCKWPRRQSSSVIHRFVGLNVMHTQTAVSMLP